MPFPLLSSFGSVNATEEMNLRFQGELFNPILAVGLGLVLFLMPTLLFQAMAQNTEPETEQVYTVGRFEECDNGT